MRNAARRLNLLVDGRFKIFVWIANYYRTEAGTSGWKLQPAPNEVGGLTLLCTMRPGNQDYEALYLFPRIAMECTQYKFGPNDALLKRGIRVPDISQLCLAAREMIAGNPILRSKVEIAVLRKPELMKKQPRHAVKS